eukprot:6491404-Amphidinium_carterae.5
MSIALRTAFYRLDLDSLYETWEQEKVANDKQRLQQKCAELDAVGFKACRKLSYEVIKRQAMLHHFRRVASPDHFYSFQPLLESGGKPVLQSLEDYFNDRGCEALETLATDGPLFVKILKAQPTRQRQVAVAAGARPNLRTEHIAVAVHKVHAFDGNSAVVATAPHGQAFHDKLAVAVLDGLLLDIDTKVWEVGNHRFLPDKDTHDVSMGRSIEQLPGTSRMQMPDEAAPELEAEGAAVYAYSCLELHSPQVCQIAGLKHKLHPVKCCSESWNIYWFIWLEGVFCAGIDCVEAVFTPRDLAVGESSVFELLMKLEADGWQWQRLPASKRKVAMLTPWMPGSGAERLWYCASIHPAAAYLQCLLKSEAGTLGP